MEWMNRGNRPAQPVSQQPINGQTPGNNPGVQGQKSKKRPLRDSQSVGAVLLFITSVVLIVALVFLITFGSWNKGEARYVDTTKLQAVFLNGGQVYFGKIRSLNSEYMRLSDVYYLRVNQQVQPDAAQAATANDISLVKLGCELHGPEDQMIIKASQIIFWENLKSDGQVTKAVEEFVRENPNGQVCADPTAPAAEPADQTPAVPTNGTEENN